MTDQELAWCAGLYEGEGTVTYGASHKGPLAMRINSTDLDVLELMKFRSGLGGIYGPTPPRGFGKKPFWSWTTYGQRAVDLLDAMRPWLGSRRIEQMDNKIAVWRTRPQRRPKFTEEQKLEICALRTQGVIYRILAEKHGVSIARIWQICNGRG